MKPLRAWPGATRLHPAKTPSDLVDRLIGRSTSPLLVRELTHMKVSFYPDAPLQAKAYVTSGHLASTSNLVPTAQES